MLRHHSQAYVLLREFILGKNQTGLVVAGSNDPIGPDHSKLTVGAVGDVLRADPVVYTGVGTTQGTLVFPSATVAAWDSFMATRWASKHHTSSVSASSIGTPSPTSDALSLRVSFGMLFSLLLAVLCAAWTL
jgi:carboxypeptidase D